MGLLIKNINDITAKPTSHGVGLKKVLLADNESASNITQIAETTLQAGETAAAHVHHDMVECFYVISGELEISINDKVHHLVEGDFIYVPEGYNHELQAKSLTKIITIGCKV